jgi:hypothetical protein
MLLQPLKLIVTLNTTMQTHTAHVKHQNYRSCFNWKIWTMHVIKFDKKCSVYISEKIILSP